MNIIEQFKDSISEIAGWRHDIHAHPETAFEEIRTSDFVADKLESFGIQVHRGLATTGVVGILKTGDGPSIGLRADMDALDIEELTNLTYRSTHPGKMHACGHDGHTAMLLAAARYLSETRNFTGSVVFIFQPAEENEGGGRVMVEEGLFEKFPVDAVYGMHNWPGLEVGRFAVRPGSMMAAFDTFEALFQGKGTHAAMPHLGVDPVVAAAEVVGAWQTIASRNADPQDAVVVSVTQMDAGDTWNVIPDSVRLRGTIRTFRDELRGMVVNRMEEIASGIASAYGVVSEISIQARYPAIINSENETEVAAAAAAHVVGVDAVDRNPAPSMAAEDFAFMLNEKPGCYLWIGNGPGEGGCLLHNPRYDFNDEVLPIGASYWVRLVESCLSGS